MKRLILILSGIIFIGCANKEVKLPILGVPGVHNIQNHSEVWIFYGSNDGKMAAKVNRKNTITATHWIYNIDKRLSLESVVPHLIELQNKHKNSAHSTTGMHDYFSYADTLSNQVALLAFDTVEFRIKSPLYNQEETPLNPQVDTEYFELYFDLFGFRINGKNLDKKSLETTIQELQESTRTDKKVQVSLSFDSQLTYQDYLYFSTLIHKYVTENFTVNPIETILNE